MAKSIWAIFNELISDTYSGLSRKRQACFAYSDGYSSTVPFGDRIVVHPDDVPQGLLAGNHKARNSGTQRCGDVPNLSWWDEADEADNDDEDYEEEEKDEPPSLLKARETQGCYRNPLPDHRRSAHASRYEPGYKRLASCQHQHEQNLHSSATQSLARENGRKAQGDAWGRKGVQAQIDKLKETQRRRKGAGRRTTTIVGQKVDSYNDFRPMECVGRGADGAALGDAIGGVVFEGRMDEACSGTLRAEVVMLGCYKAE